MARTAFNGSCGIRLSSRPFGSLEILCHADIVRFINTVESAARAITRKTRQWTAFACMVECDAVSNFCCGKMVMQCARKEE